MKRNIAYTYLILTFFIVSCSQQTAPPLNLEDEQQTDQSNETKRANLPKPPEAVFASESVDEKTVNEEVNAGPMPEPIEAEEYDPKDELKLAPILYEDYAWEKYMVEPGDFLVKIAKKNMVILNYGNIFTNGIKNKLVITQT